MKTKYSAAIAAMTLAGTTLAGGLAATAASDTGAQRRAASEAKVAGKALARHNSARAVTAAEAAVALQPHHAAYRTLLGQAYLSAGRFASAAGALTDAVALDPSDGAAALHLALAQIATGEWAAARTTLARYDATIAPSDRGLAIALAGDPATAVTILTQAARTPGADAKTRQNLALSLALAGRWNEAKTMASLDVSPIEADKRIVQWASFAKPTSASDQVASLLGVTPVVDPGQPVRLALSTTAPAVAAVAQPVAPVDTYMPGQTAAAETPVATEVETASASVSPTVETIMAEPVAVAKPTTSTVSFTGLPSRPATSRATVPAKPKSVAAVRRPLSRGNFYVQLGAFDNDGVARDAWGRLSRRHGALTNYAPFGTKVVAGRATFYRLSVGGFARGDADGLCRKLRSQGGRCFVRAGAGDAMAQWGRKGVQLASR